ncbi:hypothetical protein SAMN04487939_10343 [Lysobacter sp. yr284]|uniref:DUF5682 family protein n=1 Tax=Lysobacter sp. yr284 TaxID=1761791 RepID=UPI000898E8F1|nr:DUF5682 family protein [Lysobacter sp. yr284]SDY53136.1 hypothetical protein SAMN04487939_10343 [Lysobacter sp. yr284]
MSATLGYFGIRHHGPGCARSLRKALDALRPDCVLIEGPAGAEALVEHLRDAQLQPPVALLSYGVDDPQLAVFHPYAEFSPEWQAMRWAVEHGATVRFIDVPAGASLAWQRARRERLAGDAAAQTQAGEGEAPSPQELADDAARAEAPAAPQTAGEDAAESASAHPADDAGSDASAATADAERHAEHRDPLDWLAHAAGYADGESWWNHMVEERGDGEGLFEAIAAAMGELRDHAELRNGLDPHEEALREAHMRSGIRDAIKQGFERIAVVCGAWHVPALAGKATAAADKALLKDLPKLKAAATWVPWTYRHLSSASGYGAGIDSPGWYEHLWRHGGSQGRTVGWFARVARVLREHALDCSSAHLIEATRLADTLAALRDRPAPSLEELNQATLSILCNGDDAPMRLIEQALMIGERIGSVPEAVPTVPLQRDLEAQRKRLRLKAEALSKPLELDLRNDTDLQRSELLHRLLLLDIGWGRLGGAGRSRGSFREVWELAWQPGFEIELIVASRYGQTVAQAATARAIESARRAERLPDLSRLIDRVLLANLPDAVQAVAAELQARAAVDADPLSLLAALPALANVQRYGNVRNTDAAQVRHLFDGMLARACIGLTIALGGLDEEAAGDARETLLAADRAVALREDDAQTATWRGALRQLALALSATPLLRGVATRLLFDAGGFDGEAVARELGLNLSLGAEPLDAAHWLDGFLNRNAAVLLHDDAVWGLIDAWVSNLGHEHFLRVVPLLRRSFAEFEAADRRDLGQRVKRPPGAAPASAARSSWDAARAARALPLLRELFGLEPMGDAR